jgi:hypothetical protein
MSSQGIKPAAGYPLLWIVEDWPDGIHGVAVIRAEDLGVAAIRLGLDPSKEIKWVEINQWEGIPERFVGHILNEAELDEIYKISNAYFIGRKTQ